MTRSLRGVGPWMRASLKDDRLPRSTSLLGTDIGKYSLGVVTGVPLGLGTERRETLLFIKQPGEQYIWRRIFLWLMSSLTSPTASSLTLPFTAGLGREGETDTSKMPSNQLSFQPRSRLFEYYYHLRLLVIPNKVEGVVCFVFSFDLDDDRFDFDFSYHRIIINFFFLLNDH